jgi:hypothetical protein
VADPQFFDAAAHDFRLHDTSPALALGFAPIDTSQVGLSGDPAWVAAPGQVQRAPLPKPPPLPPPPPPRPYGEDCEATDVGQHPSDLFLSPEDRPDLIQVTDLAAGSTGRCLKLVRVEGLMCSWQPHVVRAGRIEELVRKQTSVGPDELAAISKFRVSVFPLLKSGSGTVSP